jgi:hypothetical protein
MNAFFQPSPRYLSLRAFVPKKEKDQGEKMDTQTGSQTENVALKIENPMQERHLSEVAESLELSAETVFAACRHEAGEEAGPVFVP